MTSLGALADRTPPSRDRYVDFLRAFSIAVVVFGHWLVAVVFWKGGELSGDSALDLLPGTRMLSWVLQVMPLFFFVGGFSHYKTVHALARSGGDYLDFLDGRVTRLMRPTAVFVVVWLALAPVLNRSLGLSQDALTAATQLVGVPLWFLVVYLAVVAVAPVMLRLHHRFGPLAIFTMAAGVALVDVARLAWGVPHIGLLNFALVWLFAHQLGFFYADGTFERLGPRLFAAMALAGIAALMLLTTLGPYSVSMVGVTDGKTSNNSPPSVCLIALTVWLVGLAMLLRPPVTRWLQRRKVWSAVIGLNSVIMTAFLWHFTALIAVVLTIYPLGWPQPDPGSWQWWALRPAWILILLAFLIPLVAAFGAFERRRTGGSGPAPPSEVGDPTHGGGTWFKPAGKACAVIGVVLLIVGMHGFAVAGFSGVASPGTDLPVELGLSPWQNGLELLVGWALVVLGHRLSRRSKIDRRGDAKRPRRSLRVARPESRPDRVPADGTARAGRKARDQKLPEVLRHLAEPSGR
jgi:fucose 4-O-acetylase-like acetyltransferase